MGLFTKTRGEGWSFDKKTGTLTISGDLPYYGMPFGKIANKVVSVVALKGARVRDGLFLFKDMKQLMKADLAELDVSKCDNLYGMFYGCSMLSSLDLKTWDTASVKSMVLMFNDCSGLKELDLSSFNVANVEDLFGTFENCSMLRVLKLGGWDTNKVTSMSQLVYHCSALETLDLTGWHVRKDAKTDRMFIDVPETLRVIADDETVIRILPEGIRVESASKLQQAEETSSEKKEARYNQAVQHEAKAEDLKTETESAVSPEPQLKAGTSPKQQPEVKLKTASAGKRTTKSTAPGWHLSEDRKTLMIDGVLPDWGDQAPPWYAQGIKRFETVIATVGAKAKTCCNMFAGCKNLKKADLNGLDTSEVVDMSGMFLQCDALESVRLCGMNVSGVRYMKSVFESCTALRNIDLSTWDIANVETMSSMFCLCGNLESIKTGPKWNPVKVTDVSSMFFNCEKLQEPGMSMWPSDSVKKCSFMFNCCRSLVKLNLSSMGVTNIKNLNYMFADCSELRDLDLAGWNTSNTTDMCRLFAGCTSLETLNLTGWHINEYTDTDSMVTGVPFSVRMITDDETAERMHPQKRKEASEFYILKGDMFYHGNGVERDYDTAAAYYEKAIKAWNINEDKKQYLSGNLEVIGDWYLSLEKDPEDYLFQDNLDRAEELFELAERLGGAEIALSIAEEYEIRDYIPDHKAKARNWYSSAALKGSAKGQYSLGAFYYNGEGVAMDRTYAREMFEKAAAQNYAPAQFQLGVMYYNGSGGLARNLSKAEALVRKAADQGYEEAKEMLRGTWFSNPYRYVRW